MTWYCSKCGTHSEVEEIEVEYKAKSYRVGFRFNIDVCKDCAKEIKEKGDRIGT